LAVAAGERELLAQAAGDRAGLLVELRLALADVAEALGGAAGPGHLPALVAALAHRGLDPAQLEHRLVQRRAAAASGLLAARAVAGAELAARIREAADRLAQRLAQLGADEGRLLRQ